MEGEWSELFAVADETPAARYKRCFVCPSCNNAICKLLTAKTTKNQGRKFYTCPAKDHKFFKWAEDVKDDELIDVPECGVVQLPTLTNCKDPNTAYTDLVEKSKQNDERADNESPMVDTSHSLQGFGATSWKIERSKCLEDKSGELSRRSSKRSRYGYLKAPRSLISAHSIALRLDTNSVSLKNNVGWKLLLDVSSPLDSTFVVQDEFPVNSGALTTLTRTLLGVENCRKSLFNSVRNADLSGTKTLHVAPDVPLCDEPSCEIPSSNIMTKSISKVFGEAVEHLQNDLLIHLETMDVWDHETMSQAAEATFAALNHLCFDHKHLEDRAKEVIHCAKLLVEIEQSMPRNVCSYQKLVDHWSSERKKLEQINNAHAKAVDTLTNNKKRLKFMHEEISSTKDWLFLMESKLSCCEVELKSMEHEIKKISKNKEVLKGEYLIVSKELEESKMLHEEKGAERYATKAAFDRASDVQRSSEEAQGDESGPKPLRVYIKMQLQELMNGMKELTAAYWATAAAANNLTTKEGRGTPHDPFHPMDELVRVEPINTIHASSLPNFDGVDS
ncbi:hypothetical protein BUALT_Bualt10G0066900 [Buddleja alternifolia]|uniref:GRF-type domain-containing protein n=1 Tax=Buddleja alternifolia TaxID=168488 RepID=A0AAV6WVT3_9LAMI|nr:hypothetical protein BUALT_Bualt10G0066900 [Buddleja alternifolia]